MMQVGVTYIKKSSANRRRIFLHDDAISYLLLSVRQV